MALYLNVSQPMGGALGWDEKKRLDELDGIFSELLRQLNFVLVNLGAENVLEAASVKAENIDTTNAQIVNAQIQNLTADKIKSGTIDLSKGIVITSGSGNEMTITKDSIAIVVDGVTRFLLTPDDNGTFGFLLNNQDGDPTIKLTSEGNAQFTGTVEGSEIYASKMYGAKKDDLEDMSKNKVFATVDEKGIKIMQDDDGNRLQKIGATVDTDGSAFLVLGAGNGDNQFTYNGVQYSDDVFMISKGRYATDITLRGMNSGIQMFQNNLAFYASNVTINTYPVATEQYVDQQIEDVKAWVQANFQPAGA